MKKFKERIKALRLENNLSQKLFAQQLDLSEKTISHYESGYSEPSLDMLLIICICFKVSAGFLLGLED